MPESDGLMHALLDEITQLTDQIEKIDLPARVEERLAKIEEAVRGNGEPGIREVLGRIDERIKVIDTNTTRLNRLDERMDVAEQRLAAIRAEGRVWAALIAAGISIVVTVASALIVGSLGAG